MDDGTSMKISVQSMMTLVEAYIVTSLDISFWMSSFGGKGKAVAIHDIGN